jgi:hypothetical protein
MNSGDFLYSIGLVALTFFFTIMLTAWSRSFMLWVVRNHLNVQILEIKDAKKVQQKYAKTVEMIKRVIKS